MSTERLEIMEEEESCEMLLWWGSMRQERSSANIGQESSEDDWRDKSMCGAASRRFSISSFCFEISAEESKFCWNLGEVI